VATASFINESLQLLSERLKRLGFEESSGVFTIELGENASGWLGLNEARDRGDCFDVNPFVGIVDEQLEERVATLAGRGGGSGELPPSVTRHLAYLLSDSGGRSQPWRFCPDADVDEVADSLVAAVADHGLPFARRLTDRAELARAIREYAFEEARAERLPVLYALMGDVAAARKVLDEELAQVESDPSEAAEEFRRFAAALERELS
jgi:hypothetical protein